VIIAHVHFREILSGYFLFSRFDWSIFVTQLVAKHMKEIIYLKNLFHSLGQIYEGHDDQLNRPGPMA
jgi:hypothetical protein